MNRSVKQHLTRLTHKLKTEASPQQVMEEVMAIVKETKSINALKPLREALTRAAGEVLPDPYGIDRICNFIASQDEVYILDGGNVWWTYFITTRITSAQIISDSNISEVLAPSTPIPVSRRVIMLTPIPEVKARVLEAQPDYLVYLGPRDNFPGYHCYSSHRLMRWPDSNDQLYLLSRHKLSLKEEDRLLAEIATLKRRLREHKTTFLLNPAGVDLSKFEVVQPVEGNSNLPSEYVWARLRKN